MLEKKRHPLPRVDIPTISPTDLKSDDNLLKKVLKSKTIVSPKSITTQTSDSSKK